MLRQHCLQLSLSVCLSFNSRFRFTISYHNINAHLIELFANSYLQSGHTKFPAAILACQRNAIDKRIFQYRYK